MRWDEWGIPRGQYRLMVGSSLDVTGPQHRSRMRRAAMLTGSYGVPWEGANQADQAWAWVDAIPDDDENDDWADAERQRLTEPMLRRYCDSYDRRSKRQRLAIYTGYPWWNEHVPPAARPRYARYKLIIAGYPFDPPARKHVPMDPASIARRSTPPSDRRPAIPAPWTVEDGWQHTGKGGLPGYAKFLDLGIYRVNPSPPPAADTDAAQVLAHLDAVRTLIGA